MIRTYTRTLKHAWKTQVHRQPLLLIKIYQHHPNVSSPEAVYEADTLPTKISPSFNVVKS